MADAKRPSLNPVTVRSRQSTQPGAPVIGISLAREFMEEKPHDGPQRVGRENQKLPCVIVAMFEETPGSPDCKMLQTAVLPEKTFLDALMLLFPDILVDVNSVKLAELRQLLFNKDRPTFGASGIS